MNAEQQALVERLRARLSTVPTLELAVLFGSRASGRAREGSDVDVAVVLRAPMSLADELAIASDLSAAVGHEVDLVVVDDRTPPLLGREIARASLCVHESTPGAFARFRAQALSRWLEWEETIAPHRARFLSRLSRGARA